MSVLVVLMPLPAHAAEGDARGGAAGGLARRDTPWRWILSEDGRQVGAQGADPPALWPRADTVAAVVPPQALSWAPIDLPKVPAGRMRAGLAGALEDALLEEAEQVHFALPPQARPGRRATVAMLAKAPLLAALQAAEAAGRAIDRVVPSHRVPTSSRPAPRDRPPATWCGQTKAAWPPCRWQATVPGR